MRTGLTVHSRLVANASIEHIQLQSVLGAYELVIPIEIEPKPIQERPWWIRPQSVRVRLGGAFEKELGTARPDLSEVVRQNAGAVPRTIRMTLPLQPYQLASMEDCRDGGDLALDFGILGDGGDGDQIRDWFRHDIRMSVPQSQWVEQLRSAGALNVLLLEIPMPVGASNLAQTDAVSRLQQAQSHFVSGNYGECVGTCRMVLEHMGVAPKSLDAFASGRTSMTKAERGRAMLAALRHFTHQALHGAGEDYTRADARLVLQMTAAAVTAGSY